MFDALNDEEIWAIANRLMDNLMDASTRIDHAAHVRDFTPRLRAIVTPEHLSRVCANYQKQNGFFTERRPLGLLRRPHAVALVWSQRFSHAEGDYVAEMLLVEDGGRCLIDHTMVY